MRETGTRWGQCGAHTDGLWGHDAEVCPGSRLAAGRAGMRSEGIPGQLCVSPGVWDAWGPPRPGVPEGQPGGARARGRCCDQVCVPSWGRAAAGKGDLVCSGAGTGAKAVEQSPPWVGRTSSGDTRPCHSRALGFDPPAAWDGGATHVLSGHAMACTGDGDNAQVCLCGCARWHRLPIPPTPAPALAPG